MTEPDNTRPELAEFIHARCTEALPGQADWALAVKNVLEIHHPNDRGDGVGRRWRRTPGGDVEFYHVPGAACAGCNFTSEEEFAYTTDECPTSRVIARIWRTHPDFEPRWAEDPDDD